MKSKEYDTTIYNNKSITKTKLILFAIIVSMLVAIMQPFAIASDTKTMATSQQSDVTKAPGVSEENAKISSDLAVENMQDVAYVLQRIREQAINIYVEATRKPVKGYDLNVVSLSKMPTNPLESQSCYLPLRKAWLVFFIGTMEPLVQILNEHVKHIDEKTKQRHLSSECIPKWCAIASDWKNSIKKLNNQLNICAAFVNDDAPMNVEVAKSAKSIDEEVTELDRILHRASKFWHDYLQKKKLGVN